MISHRLTGGWLRQEKENFNNVFAKPSSRFASVKLNCEEQRVDKIWKCLHSTRDGLDSEVIVLRISNNRMAAASSVVN